ncbi:hypothetical protein DL764_007363 [Monosporascus ibericus]|uniref:Uncharacterized protein n=1 Tax=Monosporascus ibericus TaxID=155417 RepID=A0A4Q4T1W5_9PEZI|nr:hypothetical protein DL764_007363 [Monosporascus ibericus]
MLRRYLLRHSSRVGFRPAFFTSEAPGCGRQAHLNSRLVLRHRKPPTTTLRAFAISVGALSLALSNPLEQDPPLQRDFRRLVEEATTAERRVTVAAARQVAFEMELLELAYYFDGPVVDTGESLGDIVVSHGVYIPAADSRLYTVVPADDSKLPVAAVSVNRRLQSAPTPSDEGKLTAMIMAGIVVRVVKRIGGWNDPRFDRVWSA